MRIGLIDCRSDGHHSEYAVILATELQKAKIPVCLCAAPKVISRARHEGTECEALVLPEVDAAGMTRQLRALAAYNSALEYLANWGATHVHFLYTDWHVPAIWCAVMREGLRRQQVRLTVHWASGVGCADATSRAQWVKRKPKALAFRALLKSGARALVHHRDLVPPLEKCGVPGRVDVTPYPLFSVATPDKVAVMQHRRKLKIPEKAVLLLCFGDTRHNKGVDLAVTALSCLGEEFYLLVAGRPTEIDEAAIWALGAKHRVSTRIRVEGQFIPDEDVALRFHAADIVLLPYRASFSGQSGPLTLGALVRRPIVAPELPVIAATVREYRLGCVYPAEDVAKMADAVREAAARPSSAARTAEFVRDHSARAFGAEVIRSYRAP